MISTSPVGTPAAERTQQQRQKQARGVSGVHKHDHEKPSFEARRPSASRPDQPLQSQTQATPKPKAGKSPEVHPEVETAHGANSASASSSSLHSPPESSAAQGATHFLFPLVRSFAPPAARSLFPALGSSMSCFTGPHGLTSPSACPGGSIASRPHRRSKEQVLDGDMQKASAVVDTLTFPKTAK